MLYLSRPGSRLPGPYAETVSPSISHRYHTVLRSSASFAWMRVQPLMVFEPSHAGVPSHATIGAVVSGSIVTAASSDVLALPALSTAVTV